jgi:hypothetical protein
VKIQIIQLNKDDDYISVRDRMSWNQTGYILLVWPKVSHVLDQRLEINLVKHHARNLGARLGFITQDADVRYAHELHIPCSITCIRLKKSIGGLISKQQTTCSGIGSSQTWKGCGS